MVIKNYLLQCLKFKVLLLFFAIDDNKLNICGFSTLGQTKQDIMSLWTPLGLFRHFVPILQMKWLIETITCKLLWNTSRHCTILNLHLCISVFIYIFYCCWSLCELANKFCCIAKETIKPHLFNQSLVQVSCNRNEDERRKILPQNEILNLLALKKYFQVCSFLLIQLYKILKFVWFMWLINL